MNKTLYIISFLLLIGCKDKDSPTGQSYTLNGTVKLVKTNEPVQGVELYVYSNSGVSGSLVHATTITDSTGQFHIVFNSPETGLNLGINEPDNHQTYQLLNEHGEMMSPLNIESFNSHWNIYLLPTSWLKLSFTNSNQLDFDFAWVKAQYFEQRITSDFLESSILNFKVNGLIKDSVQLELFKDTPTGDSSVQSYWQSFNAPALDTMSIELHY